MNKQQKLLMSAERAIKTLARIFARRDITEEMMADWMIQGDKLGQCRAGDAWFVGTWLKDVAHLGIIEFESAKPYSVCVVCGQDSHRLEVRSHARYCSDKCRQKAYRMRNGLNKRPIETSVTKQAFDTDAAIDHRAET